MILCKCKGTSMTLKNSTLSKKKTSETPPNPNIDITFNDMAPYISKPSKWHIGTCSRCIGQPSLL